MCTNITEKKCENRTYVTHMKFENNNYFLSHLVYILYVCILTKHSTSDSLLHAFMRQHIRTKLVNCKICFSFVYCSLHSTKSKATAKKRKKFTKKKKKILKILWKKSERLVEHNEIKLKKKKKKSSL